MPVQQPDLIGAYQAGIAMRRQRQEEERNAFAMQQAKQAAFRQKAIDAARQSGNAKLWQQLDPEGFAKNEEAQLDRQVKLGAVDAQKLALTDTWRARAAMMLEQGRDPAMVRQLLDRLGDKIEPIDIGHETAPDGGYVAAQPGRDVPGELRAMAGVEPEKAPEPPTSYREHLLEEKDPAYKAKQAEARRNKGVNVNVGQGKPLTAEATAEMADWTTVTGTLNDLFDSFTQRVPNADVIGQLQARGEKFIPNSDVQSYLDEAGTAAQMVGVILENGKLAEADFPRYLARMPQPGDSPERAKNKIENIARQVERKLNARKKAFGEQGYRVPGGAALPEKGSKQREAMNAKIRELRAAGKSDDEIRQMLGGGQ